MRNFSRLFFGPALWLLLAHSLTEMTADGCRDTANVSCILPNPMPTLEPGNLDDLWLESSCMLSCAEKVSQVAL